MVQMLFHRFQGFSEICLLQPPQEQAPRHLFFRGAVSSISSMMIWSLPVWRSQSPPFTRPVRHCISLIVIFPVFTRSPAHQSSLLF